MLTPLYGIAGAAEAMLVAEVIQAQLRRWFIARRLQHRVPLPFSAAPLVAGVIGLAMALAIRGTAHPRFAPRDALALAAGLAGYAAILCG